MIPHASLRLVLLGALASCLANAPDARATPQPTVPAPHAQPSSGPTPQAGPATDVESAGKNSQGTEVFTIGSPLFQVIDEVGNDSFTYRSGAHRVFLRDAKIVSVWDAVTGRVLRRIPPQASPSPTLRVSMAVSDNADWLATDDEKGTRVYRAPFAAAAGAFGCYNADAVSHDGRLIACGVSTSKLTVWDIATQKIVATMPKSAPDGLLRAVRFTADNQNVVGVTEAGLWRWAYANGGAVTAVYQAPSRIAYATIAALGSAAYIQLDGKKALVVSVATGKTTQVPASYITALSPSGDRIAHGVATLDVTEVASGKTVWTTKVTLPMTRIAFGDSDNDIAFLSAGRIRVAKFPEPPAALPVAARFGGWSSPGVAMIARADSLRSYNFSSRAWAVLDPTALPTTRPAKAPTWATWVASSGLDGVVSAERNERHESMIEKRYLTNCATKLRVWTPKGGAKTLTMSCSNNEQEGTEDPGWEIGGGLAVGLSTSKATVYDARTGRKVADVTVPAAASPKPEFRSAFWQAALSPTGEWMALIWRRPVVVGEGSGGPDPREDALHNAELAQNAQCEEGERGCLMVYTIELWGLKGTPHRVWQSKLERPIAGSSVTAPATPSGALAFDTTGDHLLVGLSDGEVRVVSCAHPDVPRTERLFLAPIASFVSDPGGRWLEVEDRAGEQRVWKLEP